MKNNTNKSIFVLYIKIIIYYEKININYSKDKNNNRTI